MLKTWLTARRRRRFAIADDLWRELLVSSPLFSGVDEQRLRTLTTDVLAEKRFFGAHELVVTDWMRVAIAAQAARLVLNLGIDWLRGFKTIVLYPGGFVVEHEYEDDHGVTHRVTEPLDGEAMERGGVVLAWDEAQPVLDHGGVNVVLHEIAHKLDELSGATNGMPPLHRDMTVRAWSEAFTGAFEDLIERVERDEDSRFDPYGAESPAEFFAVAVESFFMDGDALAAQYPQVAAQLDAFFNPPGGRLGA